jgi:hypothetical protein
MKYGLQIIGLVAIYNPIKSAGRYLKAELIKILNLFFLLIKESIKNQKGKKNITGSHIKTINGNIINLYNIFIFIFINKKIK